jgi:NhaA family Na+:H+ antiporter
MYRVSSFVPRFAKALLGGAGLATLWVNLSPASYYDMVERRLLDLDLPHWLAPAALQPDPAQHRRRRADGAIPLLPRQGTVGGAVAGTGRAERAAGDPACGADAGRLLGAAGVWVLVGQLVETAGEAGFATGWPVPLGSDVVLCFLVGRAAFGPGHPALHLLLLLSIATDILALLVAGLAHPDAVAAAGLASPPSRRRAGHLGASGARPAPTRPNPAPRGPAASALCPRRTYVLDRRCRLGPAAALGLLPVIPAIAHADRSFGLFAEVEELLHDPLNRLAHALAWPLTGILFLFGLTRGGIDLIGLCADHVTTLAALWLGRPLGMLVLGLGLAAVLGLRLPPGISLRDILRIAVIMAMGFTIPVLSLQSALPGGAMQEAARLGLALSLLAGPIALLLHRPRPPVTAA